MVHGSSEVAMDLWILDQMAMDLGILDQMAMDPVICIILDITTNVFYVEAFALQLLLWKTCGISGDYRKLTSPGWNFQSLLQCDKQMWATAIEMCIYQ
ncbi:hypothetical protein CDAR_254831 [Caerostris darwini]|uniref:Uncharacterized protein n=1 Tax=Caerostris darwini TaxID=1538125 RepID=A0AAV4WY37_9ARAC|nr:hypothetical protein CDAR_254831 [Caerostris darwini]